MQVTANKDVYDYGPIKRLIVGRTYIVVAKEIFDNHEEFYVVNKDKIDLDGENDPLPFDAKYFDILDTEHTDEWISRSPEHTKSLSITSFKEWFDDGFYFRAHDWDLNQNDYKILNSYLKAVLKNKNKMRKGDIFQIPSYDNKIAFVYLGPDSAALNERVYAILESPDVFPDNQFSTHLCKDFMLMHSLNRLKTIKVGKISLPALVDLNIHFVTEQDEYIDENTMKFKNIKNWITWHTDDEDSWKRVFTLENGKTYFDGGSYPAHLLFENHNNEWQKMHREIMAQLRFRASND